MIGDAQFERRFGKARDTKSYAGIRVPGEGPTDTGLMLIGERPGQSEVKARPPRPFVGLAGIEMERYLAAGGLTREQFYITNVVKDYNNGDNPTEDETKRDLPELWREIENIGPYVIGAMGKYASRVFLGDQDMDVVHGLPVWYHHPDLGPIIVVPIYHPAAGFYNADHQPLILQDFAALGRVIRGTLSPRESQPESVTVHEPNWIVLHPTSCMAIDTEGWLHRPWGLSVSSADGVGRVARANDHSIGGLQHQVELRVRDVPEYTIYVHNALHDLPIIDGLGLHLPYERIRDTMVLAYLLCDEPQGLKALAYRHTGALRQSYDEVVGPYYRAVFEEYIHSAACIDNLPDYEEQYVILVDGQPKIKRPWGIARHIRRLMGDYAKAQEQGKDFDFPKRWNAIDDYKKHCVVAAIGAPPEMSLDFVPDEEAIAYSGADAIDTRRIGPILDRRIAANGLEQVAAIDHAVIPMFDRMQRAGIKADPEYYDRLADECTTSMHAIRAEIQKLTGADINPDSGDQVAELLFDQLRLDKKAEFKIPRTEKDERYSTNDKILEALRFTHPAVGLVCDYRETSKVRSSFCWPIARYARQSIDRRIHPWFKLTRVSSGRPSCADPNLLAIPIRTALGKRVRAGLIAKDGCVLGDWDLSQIEMRYMADESQDSGLLAAFIAGRDVHDETGARLSGIPLEKYVADKSTRKKWRDPAKRVNFGVITQITEHGLAQQMRLAQATKNDRPIGDGGLSWTEADCKQMLEDYFASYTGVATYIDHCRAEALRYGFVRDRWGRMRLLPGAHSPVGRIREEALRAASSHKIQAGAAGIIKQIQAALTPYLEQWWGEGRYIEPLLQVYDELLFELEDDDAFKQEVDQVVVHCMTTTVQLSVPVGADGGFGHNWTEAKA